MRNNNYYIKWKSFRCVINDTVRKVTHTLFLFNQVIILITIIITPVKSTLSFAHIYNKRLGVNFPSSFHYSIHYILLTVSQPITLYSSWILRSYNFERWLETSWSNLKFQFSKYETFPRTAHIAPIDVKIVEGTKRWAESTCTESKGFNWRVAWVFNDVALELHWTQVERSKTCVFRVIFRQKWSDSSR